MPRKNNCCENICVVVSVHVQVCLLTKPKCCNTLYIFGMQISG